jgi:hypothetical protein
MSEIEVTREHRSLARDALYFENTVLRAWVETGESQDAGRANRVAKALAAAELRGKRAVLEEIAEQADRIHSVSYEINLGRAVKEIVCKYSQPTEGQT